MTKKKEGKKCNWKGCDMGSCGSGSCIWFLGFIGAAIYYIQAATGFWMGVWGVIKALFWPAYLVYKLLGM